MKPPLATVVLGWKCLRLNRYLAHTSLGARIQKRALLMPLARHATSQFGRQFGFRRIRTVEDFRRQVPITTYEDYRPFVARVMQGEREAMFSRDTRVLMFAMTSGTTSQPKYLPVTDEFYRAYRRSWQLWGTAVYRDHEELTWRTTLQLSSDWRQFATPSGIPSGNISGLAAETRPWYLLRHFALPGGVIKIRDYRAKHYVSLRISMASRKVGMLVTANPSTAIEIARQATLHAPSLIRDIRDGGISPEFEVSSDVRKRLGRKLRPNPRRARQLEQIYEATGRLDPRDVWPGMELLALWMGGSAGVYLPQLAEFYGDVPIRDHGISASEGRMSIPLADGTPDGLLDYAHNYYEFIPEEEYGSSHPTILEAHELQPDHNYYILLTTSGGLYRYDIHDMIRCTGHIGQVPVIRFLCKGKHFSSVTGEKLSEHQVIKAMTSSLGELGLPNCSFTLAPSLTPRLRYELLLEPGPQLLEGVRLSQLVQARLAEINMEYREKCESGRIDPVVVRQVPAGTWAALRHERSCERGNFEEFKLPCLVGDFDYVNKLPTPSPLAWEVSTP